MLPTQEQLLTEIRRALRHLYDSVFLQRSPLVLLFDEQDKAWAAPGQEAKALRQKLIEAIDQLAPGDNVPLRSEERRSYGVLRGQYIDQLSVEELTKSMGISKRQLRRELRSGLEAVVDILSAQLEWHGHPPLATKTDEGEVMAELERLGPEVGTVNLSAEVRNVEALVAPLAENMNASLRDRVRSESIVVRANRVVLRQVLLALYSWTIQNHRDSSIEVRLGVTQDDRAIFELIGPMIHCKPCKESPQQGHIVPEDLVQALQGTFECLQVGSERALRLTLPCMPTHSVLLIDDNRSIHLLFRRYLSGFPYRVQSAYDARTGLSLARADGPDVIVLDIMMPDQDGWELLNALKQAPETREIPIAVCSVLEQEAVAKSLNASAYIKKPVTQAALLSTLRSLGLSDLA